MSETPDQADVAAMLNGLKAAEAEQEGPSQLEIACGGRLLLVQTPAMLEFKDDRPNFIIDDIQAWGYTPFGILAVGYYEDGDPEEWVTKVFAGDTVHNIEFNKAKYEAIIEEIRQEEEAADGSEESVGEGTDGGVESEDSTEYAVAA